MRRTRGAAAVTRMPAIGPERFRWRGARLAALLGRQLFSDVGRSEGLRAVMS